jgi:hypothetical protein
MEKRIDKSLLKMIERANSTRGPLQPKLTLQDAKRIVRGTVGSALVCVRYADKGRTAYHFLRSHEILRSHENQKTLGRGIYEMRSAKTSYKG